MGKHVLEYVIKVTDATGKALSSATSGVRGLASKIRHALSEAGGHFGSFAKTVGSNLMNIKAGLDMAVGFVQRFVGMFAGAIREAFRFETAVANFKTLLGSVDAAKSHIDELRKFAAATPLTFDDLAAASKLMLSFGIAVKDIMPNLKMLGDISMGNAVKFQGLALVFSQVKAAGRLMGQDLLQMINQGFNPLTVISEKTGASMVELKKLMEDGAISFEMVEEAMRTATGEGGMFNNAMKDCATTGEGLMSTLQDNWTDAVRTFGNELLDVAKGGIQWCINKIQELKESGAIQEWAEKAKTAIYSVIGAFNGLADASSRTKVWGALKDVVVGSFEAAAKVAVSILAKSAKLIGGMIADGLKNPIDEYAAGRVASKEMHDEAAGMSSDQIKAKYGRTWAYDMTDQWDAEYEKRKSAIMDTMRKQSAEEDAKKMDEVVGAAGESRLERGLRVLSEFGNQAVKAANEMNATPVVSQPTAEASKPKDLKSMLEDAKNGKSGEKQANEEWERMKRIENLRLKLRSSVEKRIFDIRARNEKERHRQEMKNLDDEIRKAEEKAAKWKRESDSAVAFARGDRQTDRGRSGFEGWRNEERANEKAEEKAKKKSDREMARNDREIERLQKEAGRGKAFNTPQLQKELAKRIRFRDLQDPTKNPGKQDLAALEQKKAAAIDKMKDDLAVISAKLNDLGV